RYDRAWLYGTHGELEKAIAAYTKAIHLNKKFEDAYYNRGLLYFAAERYREAIKDFDAAVEMNPQAVDSLCNRGISYFALGNKNMAIADFDHALAISPDDGDVLYNRAIVRMVVGDRVGAEKDLQGPGQQTTAGGGKTARTAKGYFRNRYGLENGSERCLDPGGTGSRQNSRRFGDHRPGLP
ncbi:MAG: tetratricopeptide repeat protein, partial [Deltaproteobacteria bacterium]